MEHQLPELPYAVNALEPFMSEETLAFHYGKHHRAYVTNLNALIAGSHFAGMPLFDIIRTAKGPVFNNAAQVYNHTYFWNYMKPNGGGEPGVVLAEALAKRWGSVDEFKVDFKAKALANFGSGWTWLVQGTDGELDILSTSNANTPLSSTPLLTIDVWEHAYYVDHRNARASYVDAFLDHLVNWDFVETQLTT